MSMIEVPGKPGTFSLRPLSPSANNININNQYPPVLTDCDLEILEKFVVLLYDRSSTALSVVEARLDMFARKQRQYEAWGWKKLGEQWGVFWTANAPVAQSCEQLAKCGCKSECRGRCKCFRLGFTCTELCNCKCE